MCPARVRIAKAIPYIGFADSEDSYVHRSSESPWRFQTKKLFGDFALESFLRKTVRNQPDRSLESRSDSEEEGSRTPDENPKGSVGAMTNPDLEVWVALNPARGVLQSWVWNREAILKTWVPRYR